MGCDIHNHVEYRKDVYCGKDKNGKPKRKTKWFCGDYFKINPFYGIIEGEKKYNLVRFCEDRYYSLFATLANVRNYTDTPYIAEPRGLPFDVTKEVKKESDDWGDDGHSHSYFTLKELIEYQSKIGPLKHRGMISPEAQKELDENGKLPTEWWQWTSLKGWDYREWEEENTVLVPLIEALKARADDLFLITEWEWEKAPEKALEKADNIRLVFWFDN